MDAWSKSIYKNIKDVKTTLVFSNVESLYFVEDKMQNEGKTILNINRIFAGGDNKYYKNTKTKEYFYQNNLEELLLTDLPEKKWQIIQESKKIGNYLCFKAIDIASKNTKMKPVVWFTPQIPVSFGPKEFNGLPGLVVLVEMTKRAISISEIVLNPKKEIKVKKPIKGRKETIEENNKRMESYKNFFKKNHNPYI